MNLATLQNDLLKMAVTFAICLIFGYGFSLLSIPAPYMMGAVFGVWISGGFVKQLHPYLGVARWFHIPVVLGLGTLIGTSFTAQLLSQALSWWPTLLAMICATVIATAVGLFYMIVIRRRDPTVSLLACLPGGQAEILLIARDYTDKDYVVALVHLIRVATVVSATPAILALTSGYEGVQASYEVQSSFPRIWELPIPTLAAFVGCAVGGYFLALALRFPMPHLFGPMLLSGIGHIMGWIDIPRIGEFVLLAQLVIGGGIGARLAKVDFWEVISYAFDGVVNSVLVIGSYVLMALFVAWAFGLVFMQALLAFIPGGLYEVTLLALIFGFDVAFVAFHHTVRILLIFFSLPALASWLKTKA